MTVIAPAVRAVQLTRTFGSGDTAVHALDQVTVDFPRGEFTAIMGPSGSGKSTLMHCVAGLDTIDAGRVWIGEVETTDLADRDLTVLRRDRVGFVFQAFNLIPTLTARENIVLPLKLAGRRVDADRLAGIVEILGLADRLTHRPAELSGGQQQRVAVARVAAPQERVADHA